MSLPDNPHWLLCREPSSVVKSNKHVGLLCDDLGEKGEGLYNFGRLLHFGPNTLQFTQESVD